MIDIIRNLAKMGGHKDTGAVLVADDFEAHRQLLCSVLKHQGYNVVCAAKLLLLTALLTYSAGARDQTTSIHYATEFPGADAGVKITACIAALPSTGGTCDARGLEGAQSNGTVLRINKPNVTLLLGAATYYLKAGIEFCGPGFSLIGSGPGITILRMDPSYQGVLGAITGAIYSSFTGVSPNDNLLLADFEVDGNKAKVTANADAVAGQEWAQVGIYLDHIDGATLRNLWVHDTVTDALYVANASQHFQVLGGSYYNAGSSTPGVIGRGMSIGISPTDFSVAGAEIYNNKDQGIVIQSEGGGFAQDWILAGNRIYSNGGNGLDIGDNTISSRVLMDIVIRNGIITGNDIRSNGGSGVRVHSSPAANARGSVAHTERLTFSGNTITLNRQYGMMFLQAGQSLVRNITVQATNQILANTFDGITLSSEVAADLRNIFIEGQSSSSISGLGAGTNIVVK